MQQVETKFGQIIKLTLACSPQGKSCLGGGEGSLALVLAGVLAGVLVLTGDFLAGAMDFLFFISSFITGVGLARDSFTSTSSSLTAARLSARSLSGPRQLVTD